jgi:hypothetical protein
VSDVRGLIPGLTSDGYEGVPSMGGGGADDCNVKQLPHLNSAQILKYLFIYYNCSWMA